jgi:hypothetical protein
VWRSVKLSTPEELERCGGGATKHLLTALAAQSTDECPHYWNLTRNPPVQKLAHPTGHALS